MIYERQYLGKESFLIRMSRTDCSQAGAAYTDSYAADLSKYWRIEFACGSNSQSVVFSLHAVIRWPKHHQTNHNLNAGNGNGELCIIVQRWSPAVAREQHKAVLYNLMWSEFNWKNEMRFSGRIIRILHPCHIKDQKLVWLTSEWASYLVIFLHLRKTSWKIDAASQGSSAIFETGCLACVMLPWCVSTVMYCTYICTRNRR